MNRWQTGTILALLLLPLVGFVGLSTWAMWELGWFWWLWAVLPACWGLAWLLARWWKTDLLTLPPRELEAPLHWTPRDERAWELVTARARAGRNLSPAQLTTMQFYTDTANELALEIARLYHPNAKDPFGSLTIPEILAAAELAAEDLAELVRRYLPASHMITVQRWRGLTKLPGWYETFEKWYWPLSTLLAPHTVIGRYAASRYILGPVTESMQANVLAWFYMAYVEEVGRALIELNSGRLKGGAKRFRDTRSQLTPSSATARPSQPPSAAPPVGTESQSGGTAPREPEPSAPEAQTSAPAVTIALAGQVKAGKSSLINALLGSRQAATDVLPETSAVTRYRLDVPGREDHLVLLDTPGYSVDGATKSQLAETRTAVRQSDVLLLVMDVTSPARQADADFLRALTDWYASRPELKPPPILGVLTHIDLLSPVMEWSPPYNWNEPQRPKEQAIREAVGYNADHLQPTVEAVVPVCTAVERNRIYGLHEWLLPTLTTLLSEGRAVSLVRALHEDIDRQRVRNVLHQFWSVGRTLLRAGMATRPSPDNSRQRAAGDRHS